MAIDMVGEVYQKKKISGTIKSHMKMTGTIKSHGAIFGVLSIPVIHDSGEPYTGEYEVTPKFEEQILATSNKTLSNDVTIHEIYVSKTSNPSGGYTVYIGG